MLRAALIFNLIFNDGIEFGKAFLEEIGHGFVQMDFDSGQEMVLIWIKLKIVK